VHHPRLVIAAAEDVDATNNIFIGQDLMHYSAGVQILQATLKGALAPALVFLSLGISGAIWDTSWL